MKYTVRLSGNICHYQFANIKDIHQILNMEKWIISIRRKFLLDNCDLENERIITMIISNSKCLTKKPKI